LSQVLVALTDKLTTNQKKFIAEVIGTFIVVVLATGSVVLDARMNGVLGIPFIAFAPFIGGNSWGESTCSEKFRWLTLI
jgi:aquaporin Z